MKNLNVRYLCTAGIFTALIIVFTGYLHIPSYTGYVHIGDGFLYLAACLLPWPYAVIAGSFGAALADIFTGYAMWAPGTLIIKAAIVLVFSHKTQKIICKRNLLALIPASLICVAGYYLYEVILVANFASPLAGVLGNVTQAVFSGALFVAAGFAMDKAHLRNLLYSGRSHT